MKITKTASGKQTIKMSKKEWESIGKRAGWEGSLTPVPEPSPNDVLRNRFWDHTKSTNLSGEHFKTIFDAIIEQAETTDLPKDLLFNLMNNPQCPIEIKMQIQKMTFGE